MSLAASAPKRVKLELVRNVEGGEVKLLSFNADANKGEKGSAKTHVFNQKDLPPGAIAVDESSAENGETYVFKQPLPKAIVQKYSELTQRDRESATKTFQSIFEHGFQKRNCTHHSHEEETDDDVDVEATSVKSQKQGAAVARNEVAEKSTAPVASPPAPPPPPNDEAKTAANNAQPKEITVGEGQQGQAQDEFIEEASIMGEEIINEFPEFFSEPIVYDESAQNAALEMLATNFHNFVQQTEVPATAAVAATTEQKLLVSSVPSTTMTSTTTTSSANETVVVEVPKCFVNPQQQSVKREVAIVASAQPKVSAGGSSSSGTIPGLHHPTLALRLADSTKEGSVHSEHSEEPSGGIATVVHSSTTPPETLDYLKRIDRRLSRIEARLTGIETIQRQQKPAADEESDSTDSDELSEDSTLFSLRFPIRKGYNLEVLENILKVERMRKNLQHRFRKCYGLNAAETIRSLLKKLVADEVISNYVWKTIDRSHSFDSFVQVNRLVFDCTKNLFPTLTEAEYGRFMTNTLSKIHHAKILSKQKTNATNRFK